MSGILVTAKVLPDHTNEQEKVMPHVVNDHHDCPQVSIFTIEGPLFFGAAQTFENRIMETIHLKPKVLILRLGKVPFMDTTGEGYFRNIVHHFHNAGGTLLISGTSPKLKETLQKNGLYEEIGENHFFEHTGEAINYALTQLDKNKCLGCKHLAFRECSELSQTSLPKEHILSH